jgi:hypothetical protein
MATRHRSRRCTVGHGRSSDHDRDFERREAEPLPLADAIAASYEAGIWRYSLVVLSVWGLLWMLGLLASLRTNPHVVSGAGLRLRSGFQFDASIPWEQIFAIRHRRSSAHRKLHVEHNQSGASVALQRASNLEVVFREPLPADFLDGRQPRVDTIHFYADNPSALLAAAQTQLARIPEAA